MRYRLVDADYNDREFADGEIFHSKQEIRGQLISHYLPDFEDENELRRMTVDELLEIGNWRLEEV